MAAGRSATLLANYTNGCKDREVQLYAPNALARDQAPMGKGAAAGPGKATLVGTVVHASDWIK